MFTLGTICARGGSKGVPGKNVKLLAGHPLIAYSIATMQACDFVDAIIVSTDDPGIAETAAAYGAEVPFLRPAELATDASGKREVLQHALASFEEARGQRVDYVVDLDPTSPLRTVDEVRLCWQTAQLPATDVVFTATLARKNPYFNMVEIVDGYAVLSKPLPSRIVRRQDAPAVYDMNASIYVYERDHLAHDGRVLNVRSRMVEMPAERSHDIDSPIDYEFIEFMVSRGLVELSRPRLATRTA